ncbi:MAG: hypothetical protein ABIR15_21885 [Chitinophagaceae bacterium]
MLAVIVHLAVYLPFFAVQFLYNFDIAGHANAMGALPDSSQVGSIGAKDIQYPGKNCGHSPARAKIRLNKRFQPESIISFEIFHAAQPVKWLAFSKPYPVNTALHSFFLSFNQSLRGPPCVVYHFM